MSEALEALRSIALRSESPESVDELVAEVLAEGLPNPGPILTLVLTVQMGGKTDLNYLGEPEWAVQVLRGMADQVERDTEERRKAAEELL